HAESVQACVETALSVVADTPVATTCAGRTDSGVHALAQVVHFDSDAQRRPHAWRLGSNANLPATVSVIWAGVVGEGFHARYSAAERTYQYRITSRPSRPALDAQRAWHIHEPLDVATMRRAAKHLLGEHDFSAFRSAGCQANTPHRHVSELEIEARDDDVVITISANAFLQNMVRIVTGVLVDIGRGKHHPDWVTVLLANADRTAAAATAPAHGLYLAAVRYLEPHQVPSDRRHRLP
ncbi:MAG: tRNA pseudouridine(38-40) synthase TruA, partial [Gammaproteobacteria bacterium]|nr:tRNA pseudouridine(38-40) synthase TruA [Gammaproteobacteria bacterium]